MEPSNSQWNAQQSEQEGNQPMLQITENPSYCSYNMWATDQSDQTNKQRSLRTHFYSYNKWHPPHKVITQSFRIWESRPMIIEREIFWSTKRKYLTTSTCDQPLLPVKLNTREYAIKDLAYWIKWMVHCWLIRHNFLVTFTDLCLTVIRCPLFWFSHLVK